MPNCQPVIDYDDPTFDYRHYWKTRKYEDQAERLALKRLLSLVTTRGILADVGSGFGRLVPIYSPFFEKCILIDPANKLLEQAKTQTKRYPNLVFKKGIAQNLPLASKSVDVVICIRTFHHLKDPQSGIKEFFRVLKPEGFIILEFPNKIHLKSIFRSFFKKDFNYFISHIPENLSHGKELPFFNYHPAHIKSILLANGFTILKMLSVSNFRHPFFKKIIPLKILLSLESQYSVLASHFSLLTFTGPSIFVLAQKKSLN